MRDHRKGPRHTRITAHKAVDFLEQGSNALAWLDAGGGDNLRRVRDALQDMRTAFREHLLAELAKRPRRRR